MTNSSPAGNTYDKFNTTNPIARRMMQGFESDFTVLFQRTQAQRILEVGCGEGHMLRIMRQASDAQLFGLDVDIPVLKQAAVLCPDAGLAFVDGHHLSYPADAADLVVACEVLEHVARPERVLEEIARVTSRWVILSVPREPIWRVLNMARGRYLADLGNTPGHINHWSTGAFVSLAAKVFSVIDVRQPFPWTMLLCEKRR